MWKRAFIASTLIVMVVLMLNSCSSPPNNENSANDGSSTNGETISSEDREESDTAAGKNDKANQTVEPIVSLIKDGKEKLYFNITPVQFEKNFNEQSNLNLKFDATALQGETGNFSSYSASLDSFTFTFSTDDVNPEYLDYVGITLDSDNPDYLKLDPYVEAALKALNLELSAEDRETKLYDSEKYQQGMDGFEYSSLTVDQILYRYVMRYNYTETGAAMESISFWIEPDNVE